MDARVPVAAVLFDMDGTLLNSWDALLASYQDATREVLGVPAPTEPAEIDRIIQMRARESFPELAGGDLELADRIEAVFAERYRSRLPGIDLYDGVREMLLALRELGVSTAIATSKSRSRLERDLDNTGTVELFDATICGDEVPAAKPDPAPIVAILEILGVEPGEALFVGDGANDVAAGKAAGVPTVGVGYGFHPAACRAAGPDLWIDRPGELPDLVAATRNGA